MVRGLHYRGIGSRQRTLVSSGIRARQAILKSAGLRPIPVPWLRAQRQSRGEDGSGQPAGAALPFGQR